MIKFFTNTRKRVFSSVTLLSFLIQLLAPSVSYALTSGPAQPEFSSFEPVATTDMVNPVTGDFNYNLPVLNVPGPNGGGYALSLSYHGGVGMEEDASWVGYGWTLNPGAINRGKKGFPDDFKNQTIKNINTTHNTVTVSGSRDISLDILTAAAPSYGSTIKYNNFTGFSGTRQFNLGIAQGVVSVGYSKGSDGSSGFSFDFNPAALFANKQRKNLKNAQKALDDLKKVPDSECKADNIKVLTEYIENTNNSGTASNKSMQKADSRNGQIGSAISSLGTNVLGYSLADDQRPVSVSKFSGAAVSLRYNTGPTPTPLDITLRKGIGGSYAIQNPEDFECGAYGYMYARKTKHDGYDDYSVEKESSYNKRDQFMSIPFASPDDFVVTGEGMSGAFRLRKSHLDLVGPPTVKSRTNRFRAGVDVAVGVENGFGGALGASFQLLQSSKWVDDLNFGNPNVDPTDEGTYMRYNGDLAQNLNFASSGTDKPLSATIDFHLDGGYKVEVDGDLSKYQTNADASARRVKRASYVGQHTNKEMLGKKFLAYEKRKEIIELAQRDGDEYEDLIGELSSVNEDGNRYVYGLPVYSRGETSMSHGVRGGGNCVPVNKVTHYDVKNTRKIGQVVEAPYASTYLITQITSADYIDRSLDGPSQDDFGGWTKFSYDKKYGYTKEANDVEKWFDWRTPYNGLNYSKNSHSDVRDDMGTYVSGEKEMYYLKSIETKTHIAKFILNDDRRDGLAAPENDEVAANDKAAKSTKKQSYLTRIELYAKDPADATKTIGKPIKTIHLAYAGSAQELCKGLPSSSDGGGKLTLKKVWFEYEGVAKSKISPYEFVYEYKKKQAVGETYDAIKHFRLGGPVATNYEDIVKELSSVKNENPNYNVNAVDAWGNLAYNADTRNQKLMPWVYQGKRDATVEFDPAAWNLKTIVLPSGGQILVQYEEKDYNYVQNRPANCLVKLISADHINSKYSIDLSEFGDLSDDQILQYETKLKEYFGVNPAVRDDFKNLPSNKIFYKLLFKLISNASDDISACGSEYITGYCKVKSINREVLEDLETQTTKKTIVFELNNDATGNAIKTPTEACRDFYRKNRALLEINNECINPDPYDDNGRIANLEYLIPTLAIMPTPVIDNAIKHVPYGVSSRFSYLRVPMPDEKTILIDDDDEDDVEDDPKAVPVSKIGGGLRVKRIMIYDPGLIDDDETLYGTEYVYKLADGRSSGVASNEPVPEESALKHSMDKRLPQKWYHRMMSGDDLEEFEGPIGETLLPGPLVSHSRVVTKGIYSGPSAAGFTVNEYYTVKDYPSYKLVGNNPTQIDNQRQWLYLPLIFANIDIDNRWSAQGYSFATNDMHGKPKRTCRFGGIYKDDVVFDENKYLRSYEETYNYYEPGEQVPVFQENGNIGLQTLGREEDCTMEAKAVEDFGNDVSVNFHMGVGFLVWAIVPNFWVTGAISHTERKLKTVVTNRVIHYKSHLKSTKVTKDGLTYVSENRAFDPMTGDPLITVTSDEYYNSDVWNATDSKFKSHRYVYTNYNIPARYYPQYKNFGGKYVNENYITTLGSTDITAISGSNVLQYKIKVATPKNFIKGDFICLYYVDAEEKADGTYAQGFVSDVVTVGAGVNAQHFVHVKLLNTDNASNMQHLNRLRVLNSGYTNQLKVGAGQITTYNPGVLLSDTQKTVTNVLPMSPLTGTLSNVLSASASVYSDDWKMSDYILGHYGIDPTAAQYNEYTTGEKGKWRLKASYAYKAATKDEVTTAAASNTLKTFAQGTFKYQAFDHNPTATNPSWIRGNLVKYYSPNGDALEEQNAVDIPSAAKFGHNENVPLMVAANARFSNILFTGFEDWTAANVVSDRLTAHTGHKYLAVAAGAEQGSFGAIMSNDLLNKELLVKWWSRTAGEQEANWKLKVNDLSGTQPVEITTAQVSTQAIARTGTWTLYEASIKLTGVAADKKLSMSLINNLSTTAYVDDYRVQPADAQATCFVYDHNNLRLLATFDDRHFAMIYQYDAEGKLVRKIVETEKGLKTISETQYNVPGKAR